MINLQNIQTAHAAQYKKIKKWAEYLNKHFSKEDTQTARNHMKRCSPYNYYRNANENYNEYHLTPVRTVSASLQTISAAEGVENKETSYTQWEYRLIWSPWVTV